MATMLLALAGQAIGASLGGTLLGVSAAVIGQGVGAALGRAVDQKLMGGTGSVKQEGPRLDNLDVMTSQEGAPLADICGRAAVAGEVIWAAKLKETVNTSTQNVGSGKGAQSVESTTYSYSASFAISLGEGPLLHYGRIWADGRLVDLSDMINQGRVRFYSGDETQEPDPLIVAVEGAAPAYRGTAYMVFEDLALTDYGNRVPQIKVEIWGRAGEMEELITGVNLIPGSTEWGYSPTPVTSTQSNSAGEVIADKPENAARHAKVSDWQISLDQLGAILPNANTVSLVVAWFGTDLRAGLCEIEPRVEIAGKTTSTAWRAGGLSRDQANVISLAPTGRPAYGSSPSDNTVIEAIADLRARGHRVVLYPFIMMDISHDQSLPNPSGEGVQGAYPWRGRIKPRVDQNTSAEIAAFMGSAAPGDFSAGADAVSYNGPDEWRFRRFILHLAHLAKVAGGVDAFLIGTEMRGLSMSPDAPGQYPFVSALKTLAGDVKSVLPNAEIGYAADWSEYHSHRDNGEVYFHLDPLWSDDNLDFVGIDNYLPLSDWRAGKTHADYSDELGITSPYNIDYLKANIEGGEYWDWYYASAADRDTQTRTPISDGAYGEPWVYRQKAIRDWQANAHHNRPGGVREEAPTAWQPGSKPVWFTELGCPAVDFGANRPNVFSASLSSENSLPWFSSGLRDDFMQRQFLRASLEWWRDHGGAAVNLQDIQIWAWDARPWPEFPNFSAIWADGQDWMLGHWLNGRAGTAPAAEASIRRLTEKHALTEADLDMSRAYGQADGYPAAGPIGFRSYTQPLEIGLSLQGYELGGKLHFEARAAAISRPVIPKELMVDVPQGAPFTATRSALEDVAGAAILQFRNGSGSYESAASRAMIGAGPEKGVASASLPLVMDFDRGSAAAERLIRTAADGRETITFKLPRSFTDVRPGVLVPVQIGAEPARLMLVERVIDGVEKTVEARSYNAGAFGGTGRVLRQAQGVSVRASSEVLSRILELPLIAGQTGEDWDSYIATHAQPWPGSIVAARSASQEGGFQSPLTLTARASIGETLAELPPDRAYVWTLGALEIRLYSGAVIGRPDLDVLSGQNRLALNHGAGWEVVQFREAVQTGADTFQLLGLLRGQRGSDPLCEAALPAGAQVVVLDEAVQPLSLAAQELDRPLWYRIGAVNRDLSTHALRRHTGTGLGRRLFRPAHFKARSAAGDLSLSWQPRTRLAVNAWPSSGAEPQMAEAERYLVEIGPEGAPLRQIETTERQLTYSALMRANDGLAAPFRVAVAQLSDTFGPGPFATLTISE